MASSSSQAQGVEHTSECVSVAPPQAPAPPIPSSTLSKRPSSLAHQASSIVHQTSIYNLTLDDFQNAPGDPGKHLGSMNMDEFLKNIWTAEESQAMAVAMGAGSDEAPYSLSRKTVEDVWKDIAGAGIDMGLGSTDAASGAGQERQATVTEMTLEDFLMKAGVVMKENSSPGSQSFGVILDNAFASVPGSEAASRLGHGGAFLNYKGVEEDEKPDVKGLPMLSVSRESLTSSQAGPEFMQMESSRHPFPRPLDWLTNNPFRSTGVHTHQAHRNQPQHVMEANANKGVVGNGAMMGPGAAGLGVQADNGFMGPELGVGGLAACMSPLVLKTGSPSSPTSDGVGPSHGSMSSLSPLSYGLDGAIRGRKRGLEGPLEKVVERRQRRMIKNRESAARSRARKQAYTVELESEVMQLKEENLRLHLLQEEMADTRRMQFIDMLTSLGPLMAPKAQMLRRTQTCPW